MKRQEVAFLSYRRAKSNNLLLNLRIMFSLKYFKEMEKYTSINAVPKEHNGRIQYARNL